ncbi:MAG TPA: glycoside hydrolase family 3 protein [Candidatus Dormibacteraeota bacterium]|nr:glycoside hydrolase family 3 protein [Candidatus Dormibacteraeota bacterium]
MSTREELALRCVLPGFAGTVAPEWVVEGGLGGVVLFGRNIQDREQVRSLVTQLHSANLIVAIDEEGGDVTRLEAKTGSSYPGNLALGAAGDPSLTEQVARAIGLDLAGLGIDLNLAPVADVNSDPRNPVIGVRSFGSEPHDVAAQTAAWIRGLQGTGVAACAKHFPGHGDTSVDSHVALPVAGSDPHDGALAPFKAAIDAGVRAVMSAHIVAPTIDDAPATVSEKVMTGLLRDELAFKGVAISDGLDMRGISGEIGIAEAAVLAMRAGCDALCVGGGPAGPEVVDEIVGALAREVDESRLAEAAGRVEKLRVSSSHSEGDVSPDYRGIGLVAARRAICTSGPVQVHDRAVVRRFASRFSFAAGEVPWGMDVALGGRGVHLTESGEDASLVLVVRDLHRQPRLREEVEAILARRPDAIVVEMGVPACRPEGASSYIATYGSARVCAEAAAEVMRP